MSVNLWNSSSGKWKNDGLSAVIVDNPQKSQKIREKSTCISNMDML